MNALTYDTLDTPNRSVAEILPLTGIALYQDRRERAAALWREVEPKRFNLGFWYVGDCSLIDLTRFALGPQGAPECGTIACALGWLGERQVDDWFLAPLPNDIFNYLYPSRHGQGDYNPYTHAADYFGVTRDEAACLFRCADTFFYGVSAARVSGAMVGDALLKMPFTF